MQFRVTSAPSKELKMQVSKKILNILIKIVTWILIAFTIFIMVFTVFTVTTVDKNERSVFGFRFYIVTSDSMSPSDNNADLDVHFNAGDIIISKKLKDLSELKAGDVISFISMNSDNYGETVTHMIREVKTNESGRTVGYVTFGTNTGADDESLVEPDCVLGKYVGKLPKVGSFFAYVKTTPGYIVCILVPFLLLILYNGVNVIRLFKQYKKEQTAIMEAEKAEIAAERQRNKEMLRELQALKEQLAAQSTADASQSSTSEDNSDTTDV